VDLNDPIQRRAAFIVFMLTMANVVIVSLASYPTQEAATEGISRTLRDFYPLTGRRRVHGAPPRCGEGGAGDRRHLSPQCVSGDERQDCDACHKIE
jgi:hypothetical protein